MHFLGFDADVKYEVFLIKYERLDEGQNCSLHQTTEYLVISVDTLVNAAEADGMNSEKGDVERGHQGHKPVVDLVSHNEMLREQINRRYVEEARAIGVAAWVSVLQVFAIFHVDAVVDHQGPRLSQNALYRLGYEDEQAHLSACDEGVSLVLEMIRHLNAQPKSCFVTQMRNRRHYLLYYLPLREWQMFAPKHLNMYQTHRIQRVPEELLLYIQPCCIYNQ